MVSLCPKINSLKLEIIYFTVNQQNRSISAENKLVSFAHWSKKYSRIFLFNNLFDTIGWNHIFFIPLPKGTHTDISGMWNCKTCCAWKLVIPRTTTTLTHTSYTIKAIFKSQKITPRDTYARHNNQSQSIPIPHERTAELFGQNT